VKIWHEQTCFILDISHTTVFLFYLLLSGSSQRQQMSIPATWPVWWAGDQSDGSASVLAAQPYMGRYPEHFTHILRLAAPKTYRRWLEIAVDLRTLVPAKAG